MTSSQVFKGPTLAHLSLSPMRSLQSHVGIYSVNSSARQVEHYQHITENASAAST